MKKIALAGFGLVGESFFNLIKDIVSVEYVFVKNINNKDKKLNINFTDNIDCILKDKSIDVVIECISDPEAAFYLAESTLSSGKDLITCNKILVKTKIGYLSRVANENKSTIYLSSIPSGASQGEFIFPLTHKNFQSEINKMPFIFRGGGAFETAKMMLKDLEVILSANEIDGYQV